MENMQKQSLQAAMLKDIHNQRLGSLSSSSAASEKSKSHSDLSSIELGNTHFHQRPFAYRWTYPISFFEIRIITWVVSSSAILRRIRKMEMSTWNPNGSSNETRFSKTSKCSNKLNMLYLPSILCTLPVL